MLNHEALGQLQSPKLINLRIIRLIFNFTLKTNFYLQENGNHLLLRLEQPSTSENTTERNSPRVQWTEDTVDNENLGKRKSKCCCIFKKKRDWNDSDSSDEANFNF